MSVPLPVGNPKLHQHMALYSASRCADQLQQSEGSQAIQQSRLQTRIHSWRAGLFDEVIIDRHTNVTCPVQNGAVLAAVVPQTLSSGSNSPEDAARALHGLMQQDPMLKVRAGVCWSWVYRIHKYIK